MTDHHRPSTTDQLDAKPAAAANGREPTCSIGLGDIFPAAEPTEGGPVFSNEELIRATLVDVQLEGIPGEREIEARAAAADHDIAADLAVQRAFGLVGFDLIAFQLQLVGYVGAVTGDPTGICAVAEARLMARDEDQAEALSNALATLHTMGGSSGAAYAAGLVLLFARPDVDPPLAEVGIEIRHIVRSLAHVYVTREGMGYTAACARVSRELRKAVCS